MKCTRRFLLRQSILRLVRILEDHQVDQILTTQPQTDLWEIQIWQFNQILFKGICKFIKIL
jgi:hypothetical protein